MNIKDEFDFQFTGGNPKSKVESIPGHFFDPRTYMNELIINRGYLFQSYRPKIVFEEEFYDILESTSQNINIPNFETLTIPVQTLFISELEVAERFADELSKIHIASQYALLQFVEKINLTLRQFERIQKKVDLITEEAEFQLHNNIYLIEAMDKILGELIPIIQSIQIDTSIVLDSFYDIEISDWNTFKIIFKPINEDYQFDELLKIWDQLSLKTNEILTSLANKSEIYKSSIEKIRSNLIVTIDID